MHFVSLAASLRWHDHRVECRLGWAQWNPTNKPKQNSICISEKYPKISRSRGGDFSVTYSKPSAAWKRQPSLQGCTRRVFAES